ncbi:unnamed protein product [Brassica oleracea var. botrytis]|uniref:(rape) hypothetical protein n=1 Tax=Brassica napus TaxID=3708 RepID=A0A816MKE4_BRANA|nr:unnamed protein product [Brassica napus]
MELPFLSTLELKDGGSDYLGKDVSKGSNSADSYRQLHGTQNEWGWCNQKVIQG